MAVRSTLGWADLAAVPEVYAAAWSGLFGNLDLRPGETVLVRGATSSLGQAVVNLTVDYGATVIAAPRDPLRAPLLKELGAADVLIDDCALVTQVAEREIGLDAVFGVVGNSVLRDSSALVRPRGRTCQLGFLGGLESVRDLDPIADLPSGARLSFFGSAFVLGTPAFPLTGVPLEEMYAKVEAGVLQARSARARPWAGTPGPWARTRSRQKEGRRRGRHPGRVRGVCLDVTCARTPRCPRRSLSVPGR
ncbi:zinc-binding dehydrogenase [Streptomyces sp. NPDC054932]